MKKIILGVLILFSFSLNINAQEISSNTIGLRLGDSNGFGAEVSYQHKVSDNNRLEFDLGWRNGDNFTVIKIVGLYQWVRSLDGNFNWYYGVGAGLANFDIDEPVDESETSIIVAGDIGIEYNFDIPLLISLDFRPEIGTGDFNDDLDFDVALSFRYQF